MFSIEEVTFKCLLFNKQPSKGHFNYGSEMRLFSFFTLHSACLYLQNISYVSKHFDMLTRWAVM